MKPEVVFGLEGAAWPALLVNASGSILRANTAAMKVFGPALAGEAPPLSAIWSLDNGGTDGQFLMLWEQAPTPTADLKFRVAGKCGGEIHRGDLHVQQGRQQMVCPATAPGG